MLSRNEWDSMEVVSDSIVKFTRKRSPYDLPEKVTVRDAYDNEFITSYDEEGKIVFGKCVYVTKESDLNLQDEIKKLKRENKELLETTRTLLASYKDLEERLTALEYAPGSFKAKEIEEEFYARIPKEPKEPKEPNSTIKEP